jgi:Predicted transcription factor, homolog of eukaryotic MBF1
MSRIKYIDPELKKALGKVPPSIRREVGLSFDIAGRIIEILNQKHMSQADLARAVGKKPALVSRWLSGTHNFTIQTLSQIEAALGVSIIHVTKARK